MKIKVEDLMKSVTEYQSFGPTIAKEHFVEDEFTLKHKYKNQKRNKADFFLKVIG